MYNHLVEGILAMVAGELDVDLSRFANITFVWSVLVSGGNCCSSVFARSSLWCW